MADAGLGFAQLMAGVVSGAVERRRQLEERQLEQMAQEREFEQRQQLLQQKAALDLKTQESMSRFEQQQKINEDKRTLTQPDNFKKILIESYEGIDPSEAYRLSLDAYKIFKGDPKFRNSPETVGPQLAVASLMMTKYPLNDYPKSQEYELNRLLKQAEIARANAEANDASDINNFPLVYSIADNALKAKGFGGAEYADPGFVDQFIAQIQGRAFAGGVSPKAIDTSMILSQMGVNTAQDIPRNIDMVPEMTQFYYDRLTRGDGNPVIKTLALKMSPSETGMLNQRAVDTMAMHVAARWANPDSADPEFRAMARDPNIGLERAYGQELMATVAAQNFMRSDTAGIPSDEYLDPKAAILDRDTVNDIVFKRHQIKNLMSDDYPPTVTPEQVAKRLYLIRHRDVLSVPEAVGTLVESFISKRSTMTEEEAGDQAGGNDILQFLYGASKKVSKGIKELYTGEIFGD